MKLLLDANLSWRLVNKLLEHYPFVSHIDFEIGEMETDLNIFKYAKINNFIIVTNDEDFVDLVNLYGAPPKIVLLKTGNQSNNYLLQLLINQYKEIENLYNSDVTELLELF
jgi:predicted nuclease of predicted toxin-antitoxin system